MLTVSTLMTFFSDSPGVELVASGEDTASARAELLEHLQAAMDFCLQQDSMAALILIDIKEFYKVNQECGYEVGDELLLSIKKTLLDGFKKASHIGKISSNTFCFVIPELKSPALLKLAANKLKTTLEGVQDLNNNPMLLECYSSASIFDGFKGNQKTAESLLMDAETELRSAKKRNCLEIQIADAEKKRATGSIIYESLAKAIDQEELYVVYQPKVNLSTMQVDAAEALMRWKGDKIGQFTMEEFFAVAEQAGMMSNISEWLIRNALREKAAMNELGGQFSLSINLSANDLFDAALLRDLDNALEIWSVKSEEITLELTEGVIMNDQKAAFEILNRLRDKGFRVSLDDFGTGYSSLSYLRSLPVDEIKIDKSFVLEMDANRDDAEIVEVILVLAKKFNFSVVAEGIENKQTLDKLVQMGCDYAQGYYFSKPVVRDEFLNWMARFNSSSSA